MRTRAAWPITSRTPAGVPTPSPLPTARPQGAAMGGVVDYQNQTMRQAFREMAKSTLAKSK